MEACYFKQPAIAQQLVKAGADVNAKSRTGDTPLSLALQYPSEFAPVPVVKRDAKVQRALVQLLLDKGAKVNPPKSETPTGDEELMFEPPLTHAAELGDIELLGLLLKKGADANATDYRGATALFQAVDSGQLAIVERLLEAGAKPVAARGGPGMSPLHRVVGASSFERMKDPKKADAKKWERIAELLVKKGAPVDGVDERGATTLVDAINAGDVGLVGKLVALGASLKRADERGNTPLHVVAAVTRLTEPELVPVARALRTKGADPAATNKDGKRPVDVAEARSFTTLAEVLRPK